MLLMLAQGRRLAEQVHQWRPGSEACVGWWRRRSPLWCSLCRCLLSLSSLCSTGPLRGSRPPPACRPTPPPLVLALAWLLQALGVQEGPLHLSHRTPQAPAGKGWGVGHSRRLVDQGRPFLKYTVGSCWSHLDMESGSLTQLQPQPTPLIPTLSQRSGMNSWGRSQLWLLQVARGRRACHFISHAGSHQSRQPHFDTQYAEPDQACADPPHVDGKQRGGHRGVGRQQVATHSGGLGPRGPASGRDKVLCTKGLLLS